MSDRACPGCAEKTRDGFLCHKCTRRTKDALDRIADLWPALEETITRRDHFGSPSEVRSSSLYGPVPFNPQASKVSTRVRRRLGYWVSVVVTELNGTLPRPTIPAWCRYLRDNAAGLRKHAQASGWFDEVRESRDEITGVVDAPPERSRVKTGPCPDKTEDGEPCPGIIWAVYPASLDESPHMECISPAKDWEVCGKTWPSKEWSRLGARIAERTRQIDAQVARGKAGEDSTTVYKTPPDWSGPRELISVSDAAVIYGIPRTTLERWIEAGKIKRHSAPAIPDGRRGRPCLTVVDPKEVERWAPDMRLPKESAHP